MRALVKHQPILFLLAINLLFQLQNVHLYILNETQLGKIYFYRPFKLSDNDVTADFGLRSGNAGV